jgi:ATP-dependent helicase Lhr and Lhr-like helicase
MMQWGIEMTDSSLINQQVLKSFLGNFKSLTEVQSEAMPKLVNGQNLVISAGTGTGKTEAVLVPLVSRYLEYARSNDCLTWIYIIPTKALANDIYRRIELPLSRLHLNVGIRHGDRDDTYKSGTIHLLITTPESLEVLLMRPGERLNTIKAIIMDEAHLLYNTQRGLQTSLLISRLEEQSVSQTLQIACLSATIASNVNLIHFLFGKSDTFTEINVKTSRNIDAFIKQIHSEEELISFFKKLMDYAARKYLVFVKSRKQCEYITTLLQRESSISPYVFTHYSSLSTYLREDTEKKFNQAKKGICIATSTLELGIDIGDIEGVILYGLPPNVSSFLQRIGRGNRRTNTTNAICLVPHDSKNPIFELLAFCGIIELASGGNMENKGPMKLYGAMVQQALSMIAANGGSYTKFKDIYSVLSKQDYANETIVDKLLAATSEKEYTKPHGFKHRYGAGEKLYSLIDYRLIYGNIPMSSSEIPLMQNDLKLGQIPYNNLLNMDIGTVIRFGGKCWQIVKINNKEIVVKSHANTKHAMNVQYLTTGSNSMDTIILDKIRGYLTGDVVNEAFLEKTTRDKLLSYLNEIPKNLFNNQSIPVLPVDDEYYHITLAGELCNRILGTSLRLSKQKIDNIGILSPALIEFSKISTDLKLYEPFVEEIFRSSTSQTLFQTLLPEDLQRKEFVEEWRCNGDLENTLKRLKESTVTFVDPGTIEWLVSA